MVSLGREGIVGKTLSRVRAPGAFWDEGIEGSSNDASPALQAAWQRVLPEFFPELANELVVQVINVRLTRVVLITTKHVAYLRARHHRDHSVYKSKWLIPLIEIQNVRGDPESRKISISHVHKYNLRALGVWPVQMRKGLRCETRGLFEKTVLKLTKMQQAAQSGENVDEAKHKFKPSQIQDLTVLSLPYHSLSDGT